MNRLTAFFRWLTAFVGIPETPDSEAEDVFIREAGQFTKVAYSGVPGIWNLEEPIDVVVAGELKKLSQIATSAAGAWDGEPMAHVLATGWVRQKDCHFPHPEDYVYSGDIRCAQLTQGIAST